MILLTIGTLAQACTVSSFMLIRWRFNLVQPEINPRQTRLLSHGQKFCSYRTENTMTPPLQICEGSCHINLAIKFLPHFKQIVTITKANRLVALYYIVTIQSVPVSRRYSTTVSKWHSNCSKQSVTTAALRLAQPIAPTCTTHLPISF